MAKKTVKKVITKESEKTSKKTLKPTKSRKSVGGDSSKSGTLLFNSENYKWIAIGAGLILLGMIFMLGGKMPDPNTWDPDIIYSKRITVLGPLFILAGLAVEIYAIFKK